MPKRQLQGVVVSAKNNKTVSIRVDRRVAHPIYKKFVTKSKKYHAHDELNKFKEGDFVTIQESAPISKLKRWVVVYNDTAK
jgi:small subunit ribosomal protein S17